MSQELINQIKPSTLLAEYEEKRSHIKAMMSQYELAVENIKVVATVNNTYVGNVFSGHSALYEYSIEDNLKKSAWQSAYNSLNIDRYSTASEKKSFAFMLAKAPDFNRENIREVFGDYLINPRYHILKGLAEIFANLDQAYKSHSNVKIGVKALPKRIIMRGFSEFSHYAKERLKDLINALATYQDKPHVAYGELNNIVSAFKKEGEFDATNSYRLDDEFYESRGMRFKYFFNGNIHIHFDDITLTDINKALNKFYGDVLPDAYEKPTKHKENTYVSKDLQFYPTPRKVVEQILNDAYVSGRVLEPSCGDGIMLDVLRDKGVTNLIGVEIDINRASQCKAKGHSVHICNFLELTPKPDYDFVIMNPPFYGTHYLKHIRHALKFLREGGKLISVLPASAKYDGHLKEFGHSTWYDLPVASFKDSGTNIPTGYLTIKKKNEQ